MKIKNILKVSCSVGYTIPLFFTVLFTLFCISCSKPVIFISTDGNDLNPGSKRKPVATLEKALELSRTGVSKNIIIREGKYYEVSCKLSAIDSGLYISGEPGKKVYLYGGKKLQNWQKHEEWWVADAPGSADRSWDFRILIVNDTLRSRARLPGSGEFTHKSEWPYKWQSSQGGWSKEPTYEELTSMVYDPKDLGSWLDSRNAELTVFHAWDDSYVGLENNDTIKHLVKFTYPATHPAGAFAAWAERASKYIVWNIKEGMKHPGQWYLDRTAEKVFYWPYPYEKISDIDALVPTKNQLFVFENGARDISIENLKISCAGAPMSNTGYGTTEIQGAIWASGAKHLNFKNISVENVAGWAVKVEGSAIEISDCEFFSTGAGGVAYKGKNIRMERCGIHDVGKLYFGAVGINGEGEYNRVSHCELYNIPYAAINGVGNNSLAEFNLIYNFKLELKDGGAIYSGSDSTVYRNNAALFKKGNTIEGWTYYFDELSKNCIIENNLAVNTLAPVHNHMANGITVRNNLFIDQGKQRINSSLCSDLHFTGNTFIADTIVFSAPTGEPLSKARSSYNFVFQKFYEANGIVEFKGNRSYCDKMLKEILHMYETDRVVNFDPADNTHIADRNERELLRTKVPEAFSQTGYRGNFGEIFSTMVSDFALQPEHPSYLLDGCTVALTEVNSLSFQFHKPGKSIVVLKTKAPLIITEQKGLVAKLRPGWDGTLGYSLYALDIEADEAGRGQVIIIVQPVLPGLPQAQSEFDSRTSGFPDNSEAFLKWQQEWRNKLAGRLMNGGLPSRVPIGAEITGKEDHQLFTLWRVRYQTQTDRTNTLLLSLPKKVSGRVPLLIALHGHEATWGEADTGAFKPGHSDDFCAYFAERGWAVLQPATMDHTLQHAGWTLQGEWTWDAMVALDYALSLPEIDPRRVSVCGLSTGGHLAMNLLALDDRVGSGVVGCVLSSWHHYRERMRIPPHCDCGILGQLGDLIEQCDWAALAAPKPVQFQHGRQDACYCPGADPALLNREWNTSIMPEKEFEAIFTEVKKAYQLTGESDRVKLYIHDEGHRVNNEAAYKFLTDEKVKWISKRVITFSPITGGVGFINEDGSNEHYLQLPEKKDMRWSGMGPIFPDKKHCIISSYDNYSITANVTGKLYTRLWKYNLSTGELTELITKWRPSNQIFCSGLLSDGNHMLCSVCTEDNKYQLLYITDLDGSEWKLLSGKEEFIYGVQMNHNETRIAFHIASEGYTINTSGMDGKDRRRVAGDDGHLFFGPVWSPDDKWLAYLDCNNRTDPSHHYANLCIGNPEGNEHKLLTTGQSQYFGTAYGTKEHRGGGSNCTAWTPDGKYLIYTKLSEGAHHDAAYNAGMGNHLENVFSPESAKGGSSICLLDPFSGDEIPVTRYEEGRWDFRGAVSPDGEKMTYTSAKVAGRGEIFVCSINGNNNKFLTAGKDGFGADFPRWIDIIVEEGSPVSKNK